VGDVVLSSEELWTYRPVPSYNDSLLQANEVGVAEWELEYSLLEYYGLPDLSPIAMDSLLQEIRCCSLKDY
jgi:hypothetical protein